MTESFGRRWFSRLMAMFVRLAYTIYPADADAASSSSRNEVIRGFNENLAREAIIQYVVFRSALKGAEYGEACGTVEKARIPGTRIRPVS